MSPHISIIIIDPDRESIKSIEAIVRPYADKIKICSSTTDFCDGLRSIQEINPVVAILAVNNLDQGVKDICSILSISPRLSVFVISEVKNPDWIIRMMRAGAMEYILKPIDAIDLYEGLQKVGRLHFENPARVTPEIKGKIISVYNPVGGMGTTTISVNLAAVLAETSDKVALLDLNFFSGDMTTFLDMNPKYTLSNLTANVSRIDAGFLMSVMAKHKSGIYLLSEPLDVDEAADITPEQIQRVIIELKHIFSYIIIDTGGHLFGTNQLIFENSDQIIFNTVLSLPALKNANRYLTALEKHGIDRSKIKLVVNRYLSRSDIKVEDAEKVLGHRVSTTIPNEYADVIDSINKGEPLITLYPRSPVSKAIRKMAEIFHS